jgi:ribonuclease J
VVATVDTEERLLHSGPEIISRGFIYVREAEEFMDEVRAVAFDSIMSILERRERVDRTKLKRRVNDDLTKFLYSRTRRKPMILPIIMNV